jgi:hypothetical protein
MTKEQDDQGRRMRAALHRIEAAAALIESTAIARLPPMLDGGERAARVYETTAEQIEAMAEVYAVRSKSQIEHARNLADFQARLAASLAAGG